MSSTSGSSLPVLVAGAGPAGLVLALLLVKNGVPVRIIDKRTVYSVEFRGAGMQPRSLELHGLLGTLPDIQARGVPMSDVRLYDPKDGTKVLKDYPFVERAEPTPAFSMMNSFKINQSHQEAIIRSHLEKYDCKVELGTALSFFKQSNDLVEAHLLKADGSQEIANFSWLVGADGAKGVTRKLLGLSFEGDRAGLTILIGDIRVVDGDLDETHLHAWGDIKTKSVSLIYTGEKQIYNFIIMDNSIQDEIPLTKEFLTVKIVEITGRADLKFGEVIYSAHYRPSTRMVDSFRKGRAFVAGDAAHIHSFTGGQGMNSSIQDSFNLAWKLALVHNGASPDTLLDSYTEERLPVISAMIATTRGLLNAIISGEQSFVKGNHNRGGPLRMLGVNYRGSPIVLDERTQLRSEEMADVYGVRNDGLVVAGDRAPDAPGLEFIAFGGGREGMIEDAEGKSTKLFEIFNSTSHTVLFFAAAQPESAGQDLSRALDTLKSYSIDIQPIILLRVPGDIQETSSFAIGTQVDGKNVRAYSDAGRHAFENYAVEGGGLTIVVVRPDGVIGAVVLSGAEGLRRYFSGILL